MYPIFWTISLKMSKMYDVSHRTALPQPSQKHVLHIHADWTPRLRFSEAIIVGYHAATICESNTNQSGEQSRSVCGSRDDMHVRPSSSKKTKYFLHQLQLHHIKIGKSPISSSDGSSMFSGFI